MPNAAKAPPVSLSEVLARRDQGHRCRIRRGQGARHFDHASERRKLASFEGSPGWQIITPFRSDEGIVVLVDRGFVPADLKDPAKRNESPAPVELNAVVRAHGHERGSFQPDNDADGNIWYWWDIPAMLSSVAIAPDMRVAPFILQELPGSDPNRLPAPRRPRSAAAQQPSPICADLVCLRCTLLVIAGLFIRKRGKQAMLEATGLPASLQFPFERFFRAIRVHPGRGPGAWL